MDISILLSYRFIFFESTNIIQHYFFVQINSVDLNRHSISFKEKIQIFKNINK